jgi:hypothetical protein
MFPRPFPRGRGRTAARRPFRLGVELLEGRWVPSTLTFTAPSGNGLDDMLLRRNGNKVELFDNGTLVRSQSLGGLTAITINGASGEDDRLTIDFSFGGVFSVRDGIAFNNAANVAGTDTLVVNATTGNDSIAMTATGLTVDGSAITFSGLEQLQVNALAGADTVTMTGMNPLTATTVNAGVDTQADSFSFNFPGDFLGSLTTLHFEAASGHAHGNFAGSWTAQGSGTIDNLTVDGSVATTGTVMTEDLTTMKVGGDFNGTASALGSGSIGDLEVGGSVGSTATVMTEDLTTMKVVGTFDGSLSALGSGTIGTLDVGAVGPTGQVNSEDITNLNVVHNLDGAVTVTQTPDSTGTLGTMTVGGDLNGSVSVTALTNGTVDGTLNGSVTASGSGTIGSLDLGAVGTTGTVNSEDITTLTVTRDMSGAVTVTQTPDSTGTLGTMTVGGSTEGSVTAANVGTISAAAGVAGSPVLTVTEAGVKRTLVATRADNGLPTPASVKFAYFYDSTGTGDPKLAVRVTNGDPSTAADDVRFDLSLVSSTAAKFELSRLDAVGTSGIRSVAVGGDILPGVTAAQATYFGFPATTPGGVRLPADALAAVAARGDVVAGTLQAASLQAVGFGSATANGVTTPAESATKNDAAGLLAPGTATVPANDTFLVPFGEARKVVLFLDTGPSTFDVKGVLFADQIVDNASVTAAVKAVAGGIKTVSLTGDGGSIQTAQPIATSITSTGPLGDLTLSSSTGVGDVTAPSIFGNINTSGPIFGTVQTTVGDIGQLVTDASGTRVTTINTTQGIPGRIISRGSLVSQVNSQKEFTGVIAAQGDLGAGFVNSAGQLVRFGGILSNGQFGGSLVVLGNILGDVLAKSGLSGRIAVHGRAIAGLDPLRVGFLGNLSVSGNVETTGAVASDGVIGDAAGGTFFSSGTVKGILAARGDINFGGVGNTQSAAIFENAMGVNATEIDAIFTQGGQPLAFDQIGFDLAGLGLILTDLGNLHVGPDGNLTGPMP